MIILMNLVDYELSNLYFDERVVPIIRKYEGTKYTNDSADPGGPTKFGWTLKTFRKLINPKANKKTIQNLTEYNAMTYYKKYFWDGYGASKISNHALALTLILSQINLGPYRPNRLLQQMANKFCGHNLVTDGRLGTKSINAINTCQYLWPGFPYVLYNYYAHDKGIAPVWKWASSGLTKRIFQGIDHD